MFKGLVFINTRDRGGRKYNFFLQKIHNPSKFPFKFSYPIWKSSKTFIPQHVQAFMCWSLLRYLRTQLKTGLNINIWLPLTNLIALNLKESSHINYVQYWRG